MCVYALTCGILNLAFDHSNCTFLPCEGMLLLFLPHKSWRQLCAACCMQCTWLEVNEDEWAPKRTWDESATCSTRNKKPRSKRHRRHEPQHRGFWFAHNRLYLRVNSPLESAQQSLPSRYLATREHHRRPWMTKVSRGCHPACARCAVICLLFKSSFLSGARLSRAAGSALQQPDSMMLNSLHGDSRGDGGVCVHVLT